MFKSREHAGQDAANASTVIGNGTFLKGPVRGKGAITIHGKVEGNINYEGTVFIGKEGGVLGNIESDVLVVNGKMYGGVRCKEKTIIKSGGILKGNVKTGALIIEDGATFSGKSSMTNAGEEEADSNSNSEEEEGRIVRDSTIWEEEIRLNQKIRHLEALFSRSIQAWGLVRFNAYKEVGGNLSFSAALIDKQENGLVLSSIVGRDESRIYSTILNEGKSDKKLSNEEMNALKEAKEYLQRQLSPSAVQ